MKTGNTSEFPNGAIRGRKLKSTLLSGAAFLLLAGSVPAAAGEIRLETRLSGGAIGGLEPSGHAEFRMRAGDTRFSAEVEDVNLPAGTVLRVSVRGTEVGTITIGPAPVRGGDLNLDSRTTGPVMEMRSGDTVTVAGPNGSILAGVLQERAAGERRLRGDDLADVNRRDDALRCQAAGEAVMLRSALSGGPIGGVEPLGSAQFRAGGAGGEARFSVEVEHLNLPAGTVLDVFVNGNRLGSITLAGERFRGGELELETHDGNGTLAIKGGDTVTVSGPSGLVLSGVLQPFSFCEPSAPAVPQTQAHDKGDDDAPSLETRLAGGALGGLEPSGHAEFRNRPERNERTFKVEVEDVNLPAGTMLDVFVGGQKAGSIRVGPAPERGGELELESEHGDIVPSVNDGDLIVVVVQGTNAPILSGVVRMRSVSTEAPDDHGMQSPGTDDGPDDHNQGSGGNSGSGSGGNSGSSSGDNSGSGSGSGHDDDHSDDHGGDSSGKH